MRSHRASPVYASRCMLQATSAHNGPHARRYQPRIGFVSYRSGRMDFRTMQDNRWPENMQGRRGQYSLTWEQRQECMGDEKEVTKARLLASLGGSLPHLGCWCLFNYKCCCKRHAGFPAYELQAPVAKRSSAVRASGGGAFVNPLFAG